MPHPDFYDLIVENVYQEMKDRGLNYKDLERLLNISSSYLRKIHSRSCKQHYQIKHLFILSQEWGVPVDSLLPTMETMEKMEYTKKFEYSKKRELCEYLISELKKSKVED